MAGGHLHRPAGDAVVFYMVPLAPRPSVTDSANTSPTPTLVRKLATILSADVAGYSRLMAEDEEQTLLTFRSHSAVFEALVAQHCGRIFNRAGDAILAEFDSAVEAVRCATDIQSALQTRNAALPENRRVQFRIGVNLGDVLRQGDDLLGDGVNVAARLQGAAAPGGICLSGSVYDQIQNKLSLRFKPLGEMSFKNIPQPVRTFSIIGGDGSTLPVPEAARSYRRAVVVIAVVALLATAGGTGWYWSQRHGPPAASAPQTAIPNAVPLPAEPPAAGAPTPPASATVPDGLYGGKICYGPSPSDPARCFHAEATLSQGHLAGQWKAREPDVMVYLSGVVNAGGDAQIEIHGVKADGSRFFQLDLTGRLANDALTASGTFFSGRTATLDWRRQK